MYQYSRQPKNLKLGKFCKPKINVHKAFSGSDTACMLYLLCFVFKMFLFNQETMVKWIYISLFILPAFFWDLIRAFKDNGEFQLLQKTLKEYLYKPHYKNVSTV